MQLVTGYTGTPHVSAQDDSIRNVMLGEFGGRGVFPVLNEFEATAITANEVRVYSGYGINQGRLFKIDRNAYDSLTIENGTAGTKRADLIVARYTRDEQTGIEGCELVVIKGTAGSTYVDPTYTTGDILQGALQDDMLMYRVKINGVAIEGIDELFTTYRSLIGGIEPVVDAQVDANFDSKLASYQARFEAMTAQDHAAYSQMKNDDHAAYSQMMNDDHAAYSQMMNDDDSAFDTWFASIQALIDEQTATRLANAIAKHDQDFAPVEATTTASQAYAVGDYLVNGNYLYRVTQAIVSGGTITVGTNVTRAVVSDILKYFDNNGVLGVANGGTGNGIGLIQTGRKAGSSVGTRATCEGFDTIASGNYSHAEGKETQATGQYSHAEGWFSKATGGEGSHAEGRNTTAGNLACHAEGINTVASGQYSHAEGAYTVASGDYSHASGESTTAVGNHQFVCGHRNIPDEDGLYLFIVGNGEGADEGNALTLDWSGNLKATSYSNFSSKKYKKNIKDMTDAEAKKLLELNPVSYDYKSDKLPDGQFGLIAEDVEKVMTYPLVYENDEVDSIDYSKFVPALIKMVQIQQKEIDRLKELIEK